MGKDLWPNEIVQMMQQQNKAEILLQLKKEVISSDKERGKQRQVFERSLDCKEITNQHFFCKSWITS